MHVLSDPDIGSSQASRCLCPAGDQELLRQQGYLLASAVAYNMLRSILPLLILTLIVLTRFVDEAALLTLRRSSPWSSSARSYSRFRKGDE
jgi:hypothetical protein